mmetsp:Transcript_17504/g.29653  ORF Transcript_17504/g.29653 Transcript_17504/m.29653 type:complete len:84 (-) Transcript_17504:1297-1548(-)
MFIDVSTRSKERRLVLPIQKEQRIECPCVECAAWCRLWAFAIAVAASLRNAKIPKNATHVQDDLCSVAGTHEFSFRASDSSKM